MFNGQLLRRFWEIWKYILKIFGLLILDIREISSFDHVSFNINGHWFCNSSYETNAFSVYLNHTFFSDEAAAWRTIYYVIMKKKKFFIRVTRVQRHLTAGRTQNQKKILGAIRYAKVSVAIAESVMCSWKEYVEVYNFIFLIKNPRRRCQNPLEETEC